MAKVCPPSQGCKQMTVAGRTYSVGSDGSFHVPDGVVKRMVRDGECFVPGTALPMAKGYRCVDCGFLAVFSVCGRCGGSCELEEVTHG